MNYRTLSLCLVLLAGAVSAQAEVGIRFSAGWPDRDYHGYRDHDRPYWPNRRPYRVVEVEQDVVPAPYYASYPYPVYQAAPPFAAMPASVPPVSLTGDYGTDISNLNAKLARLRSVLQRQNQKEGITQDQYDRSINTLNGIDHDEHARAYEHGGYLSSDDFTDLYRRLDQAAQDIDIALAQ